MFRAVVKKRNDLAGNYIADFGIISGEIEEDKQQTATSTITVKDLNKSVEINDILGIYDSKGVFYFWGVIEEISDYGDNYTDKALVDLKQIRLSQFESIYNDNHLIVAQTSTTQKNFFNQKTVCDVIDLYLSSREFGFQSIKNTMQSLLIPVFSGIRDADVRKLYRGLTHSVFDSDAETHMPFPLDKEVVNLTDFYMTFSEYTAE